MFSNQQTHQAFLADHGAGNHYTHFQATAHTHSLHQMSISDHSSLAVNALLSSNSSTHTSLRRERFFAIGSY